jgi:hypothetical protein
MRICFPWSAISKLSTTNAKVRNGLHDLWHLAVRVEAHPLDAVRTGLKAADMNAELLQVKLAVSRRGVWNAEMVVSPAEPRNRWGSSRFRRPSAIDDLGPEC